MMNLHEAKIRFETIQMIYFICYFVCNLRTGLNYQDGMEDSPDLFAEDQSKVSLSLYMLDHVLIDFSFHILKYVQRRVVD